MDISWKVEWAFLEWKNGHSHDHSEYVYTYIYTYIHKQQYRTFSNFSQEYIYL
jgi:hypothetical protein